MKKKSVLIVAILLMSIGFAAISTTLIINGNAKVSENQDDFSVIFTAATLDGKDVYSSVVDETKKIITFETSELKTLNQTSILNYEVTNNSSNYDAEVKVTCVPKDGTTAKYTSIKNELENDATVVKAKETLNGTLTVTLDKTSIEEVNEEYICKLEFNAVERDELGKENIPDPVSFTTDSWKTIQKAVQTGNTSKYNVGDTKEVTIASHTNDCSTATGTGASYVCNSSVEPEKEVTVRISNMSECTTETSETACGFVVEFADIIEKHNFSSTTIKSWKDSGLRSNINGTLYNSLPNELKNAIVTTQVVSSGLSDGSAQTEDKLYLLAIKEIIGEKTIGESLNNETKQLDYYKNKGVTKSNYAEVKKQYNGVDSGWWLRTPGPSHNGYFNFVDSKGDCTTGAPSFESVGAVSPAFRIA